MALKRDGPVSIVRSYVGGFGHGLVKRCKAIVRRKRATKDHQRLQSTSDLGTTDQQHLLPSPRPGGEPSGLRPNSSGNSSNNRSPSSSPSLDAHHPEIITSLDLVALDKIAPYLRVKMADVKREQAMAFLANSSNNDEERERIEKIIEDCDNVRNEAKKGTKTARAQLERY